MKNSPSSTKRQHIYISLCTSEIYPPETFPWPWKIHHEWRYISYWRWWFSNVMLVFRGVAMFVYRFVLQDSAGVVDPNGSWSHQPRIFFCQSRFFSNNPLISIGFPYHPCMVYLNLHEWLFLIENIGINIPYMDPMGLVSCYVFILQVACLLHFFLGGSLSLYTDVLWPIDSREIKHGQFFSVSHHSLRFFRCLVRNKMGMLGTENDGRNSLVGIIHVNSWVLGAGVNYLYTPEI